LKVEDGSDIMNICSLFTRRYVEMPRPKKCRCVWNEPNVSYFKPRGVPVSLLEEVVLAVEELEAVRLKDLEGLEQEEAAQKMKVSRPTFHRILNSARSKISDALIHGKAIKIEGGTYIMVKRKFRCSECGYDWEVAYGKGRPDVCPQCRSTNIHRAAEDRGYARRGAGMGCGRRGPRI
jgi:predicted DNA-binding protein (UPF0251 family)